jgi:GTP-binding protein HflX
MTQASVLSADMLFATLDPTLRAVDLPSGLRIILSDTVGFISDLPTMLVAAFRATLEEVVEADLILHVRDISREDREAQALGVEKVLTQLGIATHENARLIEIWNKIDRLGEDARARSENLASRRPAGCRPIPVSALTGEGLARIAHEIERRLAGSRETLNIELTLSDGAGLSWLYRHAEVIGKELCEGGGLAVTVRADPGNAKKIRVKFSGSTAASAPK